MLPINVKQLKGLILTDLFTFVSFFSHEINSILFGLHGLDKNKLTQETCFKTCFLARVNAKNVHVFCVCVRHLSLSCTVVFVYLKV